MRRRHQDNYVRSVARQAVEPSQRNIVGVLLLLATEQGTPGIYVHDVLFEQISAFGTVGLSTGVTPNLSIIGRLWIIATMFMGRLGPLTLAMLMFTRKAPGVRYPEGRIMIG
jgi:trk system potassium uptake protein TrkH